MIHAYVERDRLNIHSVASVIRFEYAFPLWTKEKVWTEERTIARFDKD